MTQVTIQDSQRQNGKNSKNSKLIRGMLLGAIVGGAITMLDSTTRKKVSKGAGGIKDSTVSIVQNVKNNPGEVKDQLVNQFNSARNTLESAIKDAQSIYESLNSGVFKKVTEVAATSQEAMQNVKDAAGDVKEVGSKVAEAGSELTEPLNDLKDDKKTSSVSTSASTSSTSNFPSAVPSQSNPSDDSAKL
ncbi:YtxH domain-containing protein [Bacillus mangrovi]|uniref:YtxH domain-containing protein n=1 Tax=Metabacillus mangrovi TaxID=1491830 RepID=A0A7X2S8T0_9BACI|nr:YtxH domain-containing protein [Metabacillus mangrovi]MTH55757.1 YtxH domain-containing protein [Metabacillus mangrovi]